VDPREQAVQVDQVVVHLLTVDLVEADQIVLRCVVSSCVVGAAARRTNVVMHILQTISLSASITLSLHALTSSKVVASAVRVATFILRNTSRVVLGSVVDHLRRKAAGNALTAALAAACRMRMTTETMETLTTSVRHMTEFKDLEQLVELDSCSLLTN
jgi:hypothetical protein